MGRFATHFRYLVHFHYLVHFRNFVHLTYSFRRIECTKYPDKGLKIWDLIAFILEKKADKAIIQHFIRFPVYDTVKNDFYHHFICLYKPKKLFQIIYKKYKTDLERWKAIIGEKTENWVATFYQPFVFKIIEKQLN